MLVKFADHLKAPKSLSRPHKGVVVDNEDPRKLGRVKCTVKNLFEGDTEKLPWIYPKYLSKKNFDIPKKDTIIMVEFPFDDIYHPFYTGNWYDTTNLDEYYEIDYPHTSGFVFDNLKGSLNDKSKEAEIEHSTGTKAKITAEGTLEVMLSKDIILTVEGKHSVNSKGDIEFNSDANFKVVGKGGVDILSDGNVKLVGKGGTDVGSSGSSTNVNGSIVNLAGGGSPVALMQSTSIGVGNFGAPVVSNVIEGSSKVFAPK